MIKEKEVAFTREGLQNLEKELDNLKSVKRRDVADRIKQAIEFGDISENSEYEDAKNEQAFIEGRILSLEKITEGVIFLFLRKITILGTLPTLILKYIRELTAIAHL